MPGQPARHARPGTGQLGIRGERLGDPAVGPGCLAGEQRGDDRLLEEGVTERQNAVAGMQDVGVDRRPQHVLEPLTGHVHDRLEQLVRQGAPDHAGGAQDLLGRGGERLEPGHEQVAHGGRQAGVIVLRQGQELLGEERVALGAVVHVVEEPLVGRDTEDVADLVGLLLAAEWLERARWSPRRTSSAT